MDTSVRRSGIKKWGLLGAALLLSSCTSLLPQATQQTQTPWKTYAEAEAMFARIVPGKTTVADLRALAVDPAQTPNVALLGEADLLRRLVPASSFDVRLVEPGMQECFSLQGACFGYEIDQTMLERRRFGNFWTDFMNFKRQIDVSGWQFNAVLVVKDDVVVYKTWSGKPHVQQLEVERSPLGPLQGIGPSLLSR
jgi:hypothetical protein